MIQNKLTPPKPEPPEPAQGEVKELLSSLVVALEERGEKITIGESLSLIPTLSWRTVLFAITVLISLLGVLFKAGHWLGKRDANPEAQQIAITRIKPSALSIQDSKISTEIVKALPWLDPSVSLLFREAKTEKDAGKIVDYQIAAFWTAKFPTNTPAFRVRIPLPSDYDFTVFGFREHGEDGRILYEPLKKDSARSGIILHVPQCSPDDVVLLLCKLSRVTRGEMPKDPKDVIKLEVE